MGQIETARGRIGYLETGGGDGTRRSSSFMASGRTKASGVPQLDHFGRSGGRSHSTIPGYGESELIDGATRDDFAAAIVAAMEELGIGKAHVCGLSLGGVIAIAMHTAAPERCASLIIADSFAFHPEGQAIHDRSVAASEAMTMRALAEARSGVLLGGKASPNFAPR